MSPDDIDDNDSLGGIESFISALEGDSNAIKELEGKKDPVSIRRKLSLLVRDNRPQDIVRSIEGLELSDSWIELAIAALSSLGDRAYCARLLDWVYARHDFPLEMRCGVAYSDGSMHWTFKGRPENSSLVPGSLSDGEIAGLRDIQTRLSVTYKKLEAIGTLENELQAQLAIRYMDTNYLLGDFEQARQTCELLITRNPLPIKVGQAAIRGLSTRYSLIVDRLRNENPSKFQALFLACVLEERKLEKVEDAYRNAIALVDLAKTDEQQEDLCDLLYELSSQANHKWSDEVFDIVKRLRGPESVVFTVLKADRLLQEDGNAALALLETKRDENDQRWLRAYANVVAKIGVPAEALKAFARLADIAPDPQIFRAVIKWARKEGDQTAEQVALKRLVALEPENYSIRSQLAMLLAKAKRFSEAAVELETLRKARPDDENVAINLAVSYSFSGDLQSALKVFDQFARENVQSLVLLSARAQILQAADRAPEAFRELSLAKDAYWKEPKFLLLYMNFGYAVGEEGAANEALAQLQSLQGQGEVDEGLMRAVSLDEMRTWFTEAAERDQLIKKFILEGKMPWIMAAEMQREVPYWAWYLKTQPLNWRAEEPRNIATYSVYCTNGFRVIERNGTRALADLLCPEPGTAISIDVSALVTLHSLQLLSDAANYFRTIYVPADYLQRAIEHTRNLFPHQIKQKQAAQLIKGKADNGGIKIVTGETQVRDLLLLNEYSDEKDGPQSCKLIDVLSTLYALGLLTDIQHEEGKKVAHKKSTGVTVGRHAAIQIEESSLTTLVGLGILDVLVSTFDIYITKANHDEIASRLRAFETLEIARRQHVSLWDSIRGGDHGFKIVAVTSKPILADEDEVERDFALRSIQLAKERNTALLVDDRVCQSLVHNEKRADQFAAFSTDQFVTALYKHGNIDLRQAADFFLQLVDWRYRFLLASPEVLKELADRYRGHPPGLPLRRIARYLHDCMQDVGLFSGMEPTDPPSTIAVRLHQSWVHNIAEFLVSVWSDPSAPVAYAEQLTEWAISELLPSPPRVVNPQLQLRIASLVPRSVITRALIASGASEQIERSNQGLSAMAKSLGLSDDEYMQIVAGVVRERI